MRAYKDECGTLLRVGDVIACVHVDRLTGSYPDHFLLVLRGSYKLSLFAA